MRLTFVENTIGNSPKVPRAKFLRSGFDWKALFHVKKIVGKKNQINECIIKTFLK